MKQRTVLACKMISSRGEFCASFTSQPAALHPTVQREAAHPPMAEAWPESRIPLHGRQVLEVSQSQPEFGTRLLPVIASHTWNSQEEPPSVPVYPAYISSIFLKNTKNKALCLSMSIIYGVTAGLLVWNMVLLISFPFLCGRSTLNRCCTGKTRDQPLPESTQVASGTTTG